MDFEPPSFSLGSDDLLDCSSPGPDPPDSQFLVPEAEDEEDYCMQLLPRRRFKRLKRGEASSGEKVSRKEDEFRDRAHRYEAMEAAQTASKFSWVTLDEDDIENFSEEDASTAHGRLRHGEKSPLPHIDFKKQAPVAQNGVDSCQSFSSSRGQTKLSNVSSTWPDIANAPRVSAFGRSSGCHKLPASGEQRWRMRQPDFDEGARELKRLSTEEEFGQSAMSSTRAKCAAFGQMRSHCDFTDVATEWDGKLGEKVSESARDSDLTGARGSVQDLLRRRLKNLIPVDVLASRGGFQQETVYIDYRNQFCSGDEPRQRAMMQRNELQQGLDGRMCRAAIITKAGRGQGVRQTVPRAASSNQPTSKKNVAAGQWRTEKTGSRIYVTCDGRELRGKIAYMQHLKDIGKMSKPKKAARLSKKPLRHSNSPAGQSSSEACF